MARTESHEKTIPEIGARLKAIGGDMLKIEYLENCLKQQLANDARKWVHMNVADLYSIRLMYFEAAKNLDGAADCAVTYKDKMQILFSEAKMWIKSADYSKVHESFKKALACANDREKEILKAQLKQEYLAVAEKFEKSSRNNNAIKVYDELRVLNLLSPDEKDIVNTKLVALYTKVGRIREAMQLEQGMKK